MLFDDDEQLEVRHVISLAHHDISIYSGGDKTPEGELFIKRNALCLSRKTDSVGMTPDTQMSKPFYLFSENCSAKEDFYFAMMRNQVFGGEDTAPKPLQFDVKNIISLVQRLHSTEDHLQTRWLNAMIGRVFLGIYKTADLENLIRAKLTKKISRVKRPSFLSGITIQKIDTGDSAPYITNPRLKDLTVEGECGVEADVKYTGNFRIEVAATARIDLGSRFKAREVNLVLAVVLKKLEGHVHFKIKPPPSNRIWFSFQQMPKMEMAVEPIVSSRQITYTVILRQIESKIKEVVAETLVLPFWDDIPFFDTEHKKFRGGIWEGDDAVHPVHDFENAAAQDGDVDEVDRYEESGADTMPPIEKSASLPVITEPATGLFGRKLNGKTTSKAASSAIDIAGTNAASSGTPPRPIRSGSFTTPPTPTTGTDATNADVFRPSSSPPNESLAAEAMAHLSTRSAQPTPSDTTQPKSPHRNSTASQKSGHSSISSRDGTDTEKDTDTTPRQSRRDTVSSSNSSTHEPDHTASSPASSVKGSIRSQTGSITRGLFSRKDANQSQSSVSTTNSGAANNDLHKRTTTALAAMSNAATSAKRWGISALQRHAEGGKDNNHTGGEDASLKPAPLDLSKPMGGGRPLPPPGQPLPMPEKGSKVTTIAPPPRKKSSPPPLPERPAKEEQSKIPRRPVPKPPLPKRRTQLAESPPDDGSGAGILVVEAPMDSEPTTPITPVTPSLGDMVSMHLRDGAEDLKDDHMLEGDDSADSDKKSLDQSSKKAEVAEKDSHHALPAMPPPPTVEDDDDDGLAAWMEHDEQLAEPGATVVTSEGMAQ